MPDQTLPDHKWVGASNVPLDERAARRADRRGSVRVAVETKVEVLEVYCLNCRRPYEDVVGEPCVMTHWLHGGPIGERKKRKGNPGADDPEIGGETLGDTDFAEPYAAAAAANA